MLEQRKATLFLLGAAAFIGVSLTLTRCRTATAHAAASAQAETASGNSQPSKPSYDFFKSNVEPVFLKERPGHARCYGCHTSNARIFRLEKLAPGSKTWTDEQSQHNYQTALKLVIPGDPASSKLLLHPLAPEAGGDAFHSGGRQFASQDDPDWCTIAQWVRGSVTSTSSGFLVYVTNSAADTIDVIDPATNRVVQVISGIELPHGIAFSPDGGRVYVSTEAENALDVVDRQSGEILQKIALSGRPNNIAITNDGSRVLVGIRSGPAAVDVIDTNTLQRTKSVSVDGNVHNIFVTPDGKYAVSGSLENKTASVIDLQSEKMVWEVKFDKPVRPMAFDTNPDGSTRRMFVQLSGFHGFAIVDFAKGAEVSRITLPAQPGGFGDEEGRSGVPSHGIGVAPDGKSLWVNSTLCNCAFKYSLPALTLAGHARLPVIHTVERAPTGSVPDWITFSPDSKLVYVADSAARLVTVIDTKTLKSVAQVQVGEVPKRMKTLALH